MTRIAGIVASAERDEARSDGMRLQRVDAVAIGLVALGVRALLRDDPIERVSSLDAHARGRGERRARNERAELDELLGRDVDRAQRRARSDELDVAAHPHGLPPGAEDLPRRRLDADEAEERLLPLVAPDLQVDVDDVVVRDRHPAERVRDGERARLVAGVEVPDDPHRVAAPLDPERPGLAGLEARLVAARERDAALGDRRVHERLALAERDVAVPEEEVAREADLEPLAHPERAVRLDVDCDVGLEQREAVGVGSAGEASAAQREGERRERALASDAAEATGRALESDLRCLALRLVLDFEELADREAERAGDDEARERLHRVVVREHGVVVDLAADGDLVLRLGELGLELPEVLVGLELGIRLGDREEPAERRAEDPLGLAGLCRGLRVLGARARLGDGLERAALVCRVALHALDEVRDEVPAPLELHLDLRPRVVDAVALLDEPVVQRDEQERDDDDQRDDDENPDHGSGDSSDVARVTKIMSSSPVVRAAVEPAVDGLDGEPGLVEQAQPLGQRRASGGRTTSRRRRSGWTA